MSESPPLESPGAGAGPSIHHKAARYVGFALVGGFLLNLVLNAGFKGDAMAARIASIGAGLLFYSAVPAGIIALCGIRKHGRERLLVSGLAGILIPVVLGVLAFAVLAQLRTSSQQLFLQQVAEEMKKSAPKMIDEVTRLDGAVVENGNRLVISSTIITLNADEIDRVRWKSGLPGLRAGFAKGRMAQSVRNGATVIYRYYGKDRKLIDEVVYESKDFPK